MMLTVKRAIAALPVRKRRLSRTERRNVARVLAWAEAWQVPGGSAKRMVDEVYADAPEVVSVLQGTRVSSAAAGKQAWKRSELGIERKYRHRRIEFDAIYPCGDTVTIEARVDMMTREGERRSWPFAVVMTFDRDGRIVRDHTYMPESPHQADFRRAARAIARKP
jgi:hypothetical protein